MNWLTCQLDNIDKFTCRHDSPERPLGLSYTVKLPCWLHLRRDSHLRMTVGFAAIISRLLRWRVFIIECRHIVPPWSSPLQSAALHSHLQVPKRSPATNQELVQPSSSISYRLEVIDSCCQHRCAVITDAVAVAKTENCPCYFRPY